MTQRPDEERLASAHSVVKAAVEGHSFRPEDIEQLYQVLKPLESVLTEVHDIPAGESDTDKVTRLLWFRAHRDRMDFSFVLRSLREGNPVVRTIAVSCLKDVLETPKPLPDQQALFQARRVVLDQTRVETSPLLSFVLKQAIARLETLFLQTTQPTPEAAPANPYVAGVPIRDRKGFFGRGELLKRIADTLHGGVKGVVLYGGRRTGKTSLLLRIREGDLGKDFAPVLIDMQQAAGKKALTPVILQALAADWPDVVDKLGRPRENEVLDAELLRSAVSGVVERLEGKQLLLMFDEYEELESFFEDTATVARMISVIDNESSLLTLYAGSQAVPELRNRPLLQLLDNCHSLPVGFLEPADAERLIRTPAADRLTFSDESVAKIRHLCGGHPFYLQTICQTLFTLKNGTGAVTEADIEQVVSRLIASPPPHLVSTWEGLDENAKLVASALADPSQSGGARSPQQVIETLRAQRYPIVPPMASIQSGLSVLRRADLIRRADEASSSYVFTMDVVRRWVADSRTIWDILEKRQSEVLSQVAPFSRRALASVGDFLVTTLLSFFIGHFYDPRIALLVLPLYFGVLLPVSDRTVAMRVLRLRLVNEDGTPPQGWRSLFFALLLAVGVAPVVLAVSGVDACVPWYWVGASLVLLFEALHQVRVAVNTHHRGIYDRIARTFVIYEPVAGRGAPWKR
jgi:uncharacterized RDD family membrane protein YckC